MLSFAHAPPATPPAAHSGHGADQPASDWATKAARRAPRAPANAARRTTGLGDLRTEHRRLRRLSARLARAEDPGVRELLFQDLQDELHVHFQLESEMLHPALRDHARRPTDRRLYFQAREGHAHLERLLEAMRHTQTASEEFAAQCGLLRDGLRKHAEEEDARVHPAAQRALGAIAVHDLQRMMRRRRSTLLGAPPQESLPPLASKDRSSDGTPHPHRS